jgi:hypothetical protein
MDWGLVEKSVRLPEQNKSFVAGIDVGPEFKGPVWVYKYTHKQHGWQLSVATHAEPQSKKFSLGGFRIVPAARATPQFNPDEEAIGLCVGMEEKVYWSRRIKVGGALGLQNLERIVGGKCVLLPKAGARVGEPLDKEMLDFGIACLKDIESSGGIFLTTGQDLGHGMLSDGTASSLQYMCDRFHGSVSSDTSKPTAEGNYLLLKGALSGLGIKPEKATVGLIGVGNIGEHILSRLHELGVKVLALEALPAKRQAIEAKDIPTFTPDQKAEFLSLPMDALVVNANGGTLDAAALDLISKNDSIEFICGSENLAMPVEHGGTMLRDARKIYAPTELGGMMGYLTAVEEYLSKQAGKPFSAEQMFVPARKLEEAGLKATEYVLKHNFACTFEDAIRACYP